MRGVSHPLYSLSLGARVQYLRLPQYLGEYDKENCTIVRLQYGWLNIPAL